MTNGSVTVNSMTKHFMTKFVITHLVHHRLEPQRQRCCNTVPAVATLKIENSPVWTSRLGPIDCVALEKLIDSPGLRLL